MCDVLISPSLDLHRAQHEHGRWPRHGQGLTPARGWAGLVFFFLLEKLVSLPSEPPVVMIRPVTVDCPPPDKKNLAMTVDLEPAVIAVSGVV